MMKIPATSDVKLPETDILSKSGYPWTEHYGWEAIIGFLDEFRKPWESKGLTLEQIREAMDDKHN